MKKVSKEELEKTIKLYKELGTLDKVADYLGMTEVGVWLRLRHTGVTKVKKGPHSFVPKERHEGQVLMLESDGVKRYFYSARGAARASDGEEFACSAGDLGLIPGLGRSPGEGNGNPLQYSCLENSMD